MALSESRPMVTPADIDDDYAYSDNHAKPSTPPSLANEASSSPRTTDDEGGTDRDSDEADQVDDIELAELSAANRENILFDIVVKMRSYLTGAKHRRGFTKYKNCFTGRQAVQFMLAAKVARDSEEAVAIGSELMAAKLIVGVNKTKFEKRSHLYAYHLGVAPGISAARYFVSTELLNIESKMKHVRTVVDRHTGAVEALSSEHAAAMERVERVVSTLRLELSILRASVIALTVYVLLPFYKADALQLVRSIGIQMHIDAMLKIVAICTVCTVAFSSVLGFFHSEDLSADKLYEDKTMVEEGEPRVLAKRSLRSMDDDDVKPSTPSSFLLKSATSIGTRLGTWGRTQPLLRPEDRADPPPALDMTWVDHPCALRLSPGGPAQIISQFNQLPDNMVRAQIPFDIESELFKGQMVVYIRGLENSPSDIFNGRARTIQIAVQGKFKQEIPMDECVFGQALARPLSNLPSRWLLSLAARVVRAFGEKYSMQLSSPTADRPYMLAPIALAAQAMSCEYEGDVQDIEGPLIENVSSMSIFPEGTTAPQRQKILSKIIKNHKKGKKNQTDVPVFDTERVWTFGFWQSQINFTTYKVDLGVGQFNLLKIMNGQPLCFCAQTRAGEILFRMEIWHEQILAKAHEYYEERTRTEKQSRLPRRSSIDISRISRDLSSSFTRKVDSAIRDKR